MHRHQKDKAGDLLRKFWKPGGKIDKVNEKRLRAHVEGTHSISLFLRSHNLAEGRSKAVGKLGLR